MKVEDETGQYLVKLARYAAEKWIIEGKEPDPNEPIPEQAKFQTGAFVTVKKKIGNVPELRGCIGYVLGIKPLYEEIIDLAQASTLKDPRFPPVSEDELQDLLFEVTVLTPPAEIEYN